MAATLGESSSAGRSGCLHIDEGEYLQKQKEAGPEFIKTNPVNQNLQQEKAKEKEKEKEKKKKRKRKRKRKQRRVVGNEQRRFVGQDPGDDSESDISEEELARYYEEKSLTSGFDITARAPSSVYGRISVTCPVTDSAEDNIVKELASFAVDNYNSNRKPDEGKLKFKRAIKYSFQLVKGYLYFITLEVLDENDVVHIYQTKVWHFLDERGVKLFQPEWGRKLMTTDEFLALLRS